MICQGMLLDSTLVTVYLETWPQDTHVTHTMKQHESVAAEETA